MLLPKTHCSPKPTAQVGHIHVPKATCTPVSGAQESAPGASRCHGAPRGVHRAHSPGISGGWRGKKRGSLQASCQGECFHLRPWYFSPGACTKSPQLLSLFFCALQGSAAAEECASTQTANASKRDTCSPPASGTRSGRSSVPAAGGEGARTGFKLRGQRGQAGMLRAAQAPLWVPSRQGSP